MNDRQFQRWAKTHCRERAATGEQQQRLMAQLLYLGGCASARGNWALGMPVHMHAYHVPGWSEGRGSYQDQRVIPSVNGWPVDKRLW